MTSVPNPYPIIRSGHLGYWLLLIAFGLTLTVYWPGLSGGFLFDDYPNIVDNRGVQPPDASFSSLLGAALSSPSSEFRRPLASLSFAANYLTTGINPYWMKFTNLVIHLLNGLLVFALTRALLQVSPHRSHAHGGGRSHATPSIEPEYESAIIATHRDIPSNKVTRDEHRIGIVAALLSGGWMLLPINLTGVLYVVQRMESMANLFVLLGLIGYISGRRRMIASNAIKADRDVGIPGRGRNFEHLGFPLCVISIVLMTAIGSLAKETAIMLPLYAASLESLIFRFESRSGRHDLRLIGLFVIVLLLPMIFGLIWLLPQVLDPSYWSTRNFGLGTRLLSESRIVMDYMQWTLLPTPNALSFYHDDFYVSRNLLTPWTTLVSVAFIAALIIMILRLRERRPLVALGIALFLGCQLLTGTILPLELIYEHRNYFASFGLLLTIVPLLAVQSPVPFALPRYTLLAGLLLSWASLTAFTAYAWGNPLRLAEDLAKRAPKSPRAQYDLGRTYIIYSHYDPASPFTKLAYAPLERAAALPGASILPEQALIFMNSSMHLQVKEVWWSSLIAKLAAHSPGVQDESSLNALTQCIHEHHCNLPQNRMVAAFLAALSHPDPSAHLLAIYGDYAWNALDDRTLGERMTEEAVRAEPKEPAYRITLIKMMAARNQTEKARKQLRQLELLNFGGRLDREIRLLRTTLNAR